MKYLVLGNGAAGVTAAAKLRELDGASPITLAAAEEVPAYAKIMLPDYIGGRMEREKLFIRDAAFYSDNNICFDTGKRAVRIDTATSRVTFADDSSEEYDRLLIATGSIPFLPKIDGLDTVRYFTVNSIKDADIIKQSAKPGKNAVIMGGGLTGIEMAFAVQRLGMSAYIVEMQKTLLPQQLDEESSGIMAGYMRQEGIQILNGTAVASVEPGSADNSAGMAAPQSGTVVLSDGRRINFGMLIAAIGTRPGMSFAADAGIKCGRGILTDEFMKTSADNIYAAGDVSEPEYGIPGGFVSPYIWPNAMAQGKCAASNMAGIEQAFSGTGNARNMVQLRDMQFVSMGMVKPGEDSYEIIKAADPAGLTYQRFVLKDNKLVGMVLIGDVKRANALSSLIRRGIDTAPFRNRLTDTDFTP